MTSSGPGFFHANTTEETYVYQTRSVGFRLFGPSWPKKTQFSESVAGCEAFVNWTQASADPLAPNATNAACDFYIQHRASIAALPAECSVMVSLQSIPLLGFPQTTTSSWVTVKSDERTAVFQAAAQPATFEGRPTIGRPVEGTFLFRFRAAIVPEELVVPSYPDSITQMLNSDVSDGKTPDIQFTVFSKRCKTGGATVPRRLFGRRSLLSGKSEEFDLLIKNDFQQHETSRPFVTTHDYGYDSDSDLEDQNENEDDNHEGGDEMVTESLEGMTIAGETGENAGNGRSQNITRSIVVCDGAFKTWKALLFYLYTGHIIFAPLTSSGVEARNKSDRKHAAAHPRWPSPCSPKSMYRLANKYGFTHLEDLALRNIISHLTPQNIVEEYFSSFTLTYDNVQKPEFHYLRDMMRNSDVKAAWERHVLQILTSPEMVEYHYATSAKLLFPS